MAVLYLLVSVFALAVALSGQDPCDTNMHKVLRDSGKRSVSSKYDWKSGALATCDTFLKDGWYRIQSGAGEDMVNTAPPPKTCGTVFPVWMKGKIPTKAEGIVTRDACTYSYFGGSCSKTWKIQVKNCGAFRVYNLKKTTSCPTGYCFGTRSRCPEGQSSSTGFTPCTPTKSCEIKVEPRVEADSETVEQHTPHFGIQKFTRIRFHCKIDIPPTLVKTNYVFDISWYINNEGAIWQTSVSGAKLHDADLREHHWNQKYRLDMMVKCSYRVRKLPSVSCGQVHNSKEFFAGLEITPKELLLEEGQTKTVTVRSTVPIGCVVGSGPCKLNVYTFFDKDQEKCTLGAAEGGALLERGDCGVSIPADDWMTPVQLEVTGYVDGLYNSKERLKFLHVGTQTYLPHPVWDNYKAPDVKVKIVDKDVQLKSRRCASNNDPHMRTFDGVPWENQRSGEFVLFKHRNFPIEIHAAYQRCSQGNQVPTCNCGIAIRSYNSIFIANFCGDERVAYTEGSFNSYLNTRNCDDTNMVIQGNNPYIVTLPTGTKITFYLSRYGRGRIRYISIVPSPVDIDNTEGLCGLLNFNKIDDFSLPNRQVTTDEGEFANSWRIPVGSKKSFFTNQVQINQLTETRRHYCVCARDSEDPNNLENKVHCNLTQSTSLCSMQETASLSNILQTCGRYTDNVADNKPVIFQRVSESKARRVPDWRGGWTEVTARKYCQDIFSNSKATSLCKERAQIGPESFIKNCVKDIRFTADKSWADEQLEIFKVECLVEAKRNQTLVEVPTPDGNALLKELEDSICPKDCSNQGTCLRGVCQCTTGFGGSDCSLNLWTPPDNLRVPFGGVCQQGQRRCLSTPVYANNIADGVVYCRRRRLMIYQNQTIFENYYTTQRTTTNFPGGVTCNIPLVSDRRYQIAYGYKLSLSNDGKNFSDETGIIVKEGRCSVCDIKTFICSTGSCPRLDRKNQTKDADSDLVSYNNDNF